MMLLMCVCLSCQCLYLRNKELYQFPDGKRNVLMSRAHDVNANRLQKLNKMLKLVGHRQRQFNTKKFWR